MRGCKFFSQILRTILCVCLCELGEGGWARLNCLVEAVLIRNRKSVWSVNNNKKIMFIPCKPNLPLFFYINLYKLGLQGTCQSNAL